MSVLIVGAGPTGLVAALVLAVNGIECRIIDKSYEPGRSSRALGLQARSMELLSGLGIAERVEAVAYRLSGASVMRGDTPIVEMPWIPPESRYPYTYVVPQSGLEEILRIRLTELGIRIERGAELTSLVASDGGVTAQLTDGREISAEWLVGADGARSRVRESIGIEFPHTATGETYYLADATIDLGIELGDSGLWLSPDGPIMLMRLPGDPQTWRAFIDMSDTARDADLPALDIPTLQNLLESRGPRRVEVESLQWSSVFRSRIGLADAYRAGRVFLAGDATHVFPPFGGQGMNLGIQDAVNLAWRLAGVTHGAPEDLLDDYERERRPVAASTIADVETRRRMYALRQPIARAARDLLLRWAGGNRRAQRRASRQNSQLDTSYRRVTPGGDRGPLPRPGDRAPDAPLPGGALHQLFSPDRATLLIFTPETIEAGTAREPGLCTARISTTSECDRPAREFYGFREGERGYVLVRPDGHVARRGVDPDEGRAAVAAIVGPGRTRR